VYEFPRTLAVPPVAVWGSSAHGAICFNNLAAYDILYTLVAQKSPETPKVSAMGDSGPEACFTIVVIGWSASSCWI
jgi:hypothetical protein